jgi:hypothetical protein
VVKVAGAVSIAGIAASAVVRVARRHSSPQHRVSARAVIAASVSATAPRHNSSPAARTLIVACDPHAWLEHALCLRAAQSASQGVMLGVAVSAVPGIGAAVDLREVCRSTVRGALPVHDLETIALSLCSLPRESHRPAGISQGRGRRGEGPRGHGGRPGTPAASSSEGGLAGWLEGRKRKSPEANERFGAW